jgi:colanic acid/amylovoran biosynthesis glycosyltransferase
MKIAFIVSVFPRLSETFILDQITGLLDMGHDVKIFAYNNPGETKVHQDVYDYRLKERVYYWNIPQNKILRILTAIFLTLLNFFINPIKIINFLNVFKYGKEAFSSKILILHPFLKEKFDIIHCHFGTNGILGTYLKKRNVAGKYITSFHGYDVNRYPKIAGEKVYHDLFNSGDLFTANTEFTKQQLINIGCEKNKIVILPMGLSIDKFKFSVKEIKPGESIKILTVGRLTEKKGHEIAIRAVAYLIPKYENILYNIVGEGSLRVHLENLVSELNIGRYVKFLGEVEQGEVIKLYEQAHIFLLPCVTAKDGDKEGQALVLQEAQAMGIPVVSTFHNGIPEGVLNGKSGFLVPENDVEALYRQIEYIITHPEKWPEMGRYGREFIEGKYDMRKLNKQLLSIYQRQLIGK